MVVLLQDPPPNDIMISNSDQDCDTPIISTITPVAAEATYNFSVFAKADGDLTGISSHMNVTVEAVAPTLTPPAGRKLVEQKGITQREVALDVCPCLVSKEPGTITLAGLIVCVTTNDDDCEAGAYY
ncbi:hypothetical protein V1264_024954 [Littorina saxatilis]|uniref:Uncharacterized protein n=1 Tax=Littorina saxatilis TaxID=31220 RepID=A0AAN9AMM8_9CAEN